MSLLERLAQFISDNQLFARGDRLLLGVSGGKDSMLMMTLLHTLGYECVVAHCNFQLRGEDADRDEEVVRNQANALGLDFVQERYDTAAYAHDHKVSIQMAARDLRYDWFEAMRKIHGCAYICIAQHQQDHIETVFVNLVRGTGVRGLQGILPKRGYIVRPILFMTSADISDVVKKQSIPYRDDQSNFDNKYIRNKIRLDILPHFRGINAGFDAVMAQNIARFQEVTTLLESFVKPLRKRLFVPEHQRLRIAKADLEVYLGDLPMLYELFAPYSFEKNVLQDLIDSWNNGSGLVFESPTHVLYLDRDQLFLKERGECIKEEKYISSDDRFVSFGDCAITLSFSDANVDMEWTSFNEAMVDAELLMFPLTLRTWREGDRFQPLGMEGSKKLSEFFISKKVPLVDKSRIPILVNGNDEIIWVVGLRLDNRYRIAENTKKVATFVRH